MDDHIAFYSLLQALIICIVFFPYFACISTRFRAAGAIINIIYCLVWFSLDVAECDIEMNSYNLKILNNSRFKAIIGLRYLPSFVCQMVFIVYCIYILYRCIKSKSFVSQRIPGAVRPHQVEHVRWVLRKSKDTLYQASLSASQTSFVACMNKSKKLRLFTDLPFFKYPTKIVYLTLFQLITTYMVSFIVINMIMFIDGLSEKMNNFVPFLNVPVEITEIIKACLAISLVYVVVLTLFNIMMFIRNYRYHMLKLFQGDSAFISDWQYSSYSKLTSSVNCVGYVIIFSVWSFLLGFVAVSLLLIVVIGIFYIADKFGKIGPLIERLATILCFLLIGQMFRLVMYLLSRKYLLQRKIQEKDKEMPLNVENRKLFEILSYFYLYLAMAGGIMSCLRRFLLSASFGFFSMGRLDKSIYSRDLQKFDGAYATYVAMLQVDNAHNNPSMRLFAHLLWSEVLIARLQCSGGTSTELAHLIDTLNHGVTRSNSIKTHNHSSDVYVVSEAANVKSKLARTRWFLAYTLLNNPQLKACRRKEMPQFNGEGMQLQIISTNTTFDFNTLT